MGTGSAVRSARFFVAAVRMSFRRNLQYRGQHMINNVASAIFGFIYIAIWQAATRGWPGDSVYSSEVLAQYVMVNQCVLWLTTFDRFGVQLAGRVRDGTIGSDLLRPVNFMVLQMGQIYGGKLYNFFFRSLALAAIFGLAVGMPWPTGRLLLVVLALLLATHIGSVLMYFVGLAGFWTVEASWLYLLFQTMTLLLGGPSIPLDFLPAGVSVIARAMPFACLGYYPAAVYLGLGGAGHLAIMAGWAVALTVLAAYVTVRARQRAEVVGG